MMMQQESIPTSYRILTLFARDFPANHSPLQDADLDLLIQEVRSFMRLSEWLKQKDLHIFFLKTFRGCSITAKGKLSPLSSIRFQTWGIVLNGVCLTAPILVSRNSEREYTLSDILIKDCPEKYFLSDKAAEVILSKWSEVRKGAESTPQTETAYVSQVKVEAAEQRQDSIS